MDNEPRDITAGGNYINPETGITIDCLNVWAAIAASAKLIEDPDMFAVFIELAQKELPSYEEYTRQANAQNPEYAEELIRNTDPVKKAKFNALVAEFNANKDRLIREKDFETIRRICTEAEEVVRSRKTAMKEPEGLRGGGFVHPELGLDGDSYNAWNTLGLMITNPELPLTKLHDLPTYEEYIRTRHYDPSKTDALIKDSNPEKVRAFNDLVARYNADRERIVRENDLEAVKRFWEEANTLTRGRFGK
ncbi:MAG: hypothetical protein HYV13_00030 [Candidatus Doudnabacteria bacterium]|nr:hypothetical protein [Candidatus Doudnabacteria bacterium]